MLQRKLTLVEIGGSALPSPSPAAPRYANWFPMPYKVAAVPPVEGVTPNPVADGVLIEWAAVDQEGVIYVIERGPTAQGPWTEIHRTTETRYLYSDGSGQKWWFKVTPTVRGKPGAGSVVEATPPTTTADLVEQQEKLAAETLARMRADAAEAAARAADMAQAAQDLLAEATLRQQQYADAMQSIADEARARADAVLNEKLEREASITLEQQTRQSEVDSLARQVAEVAAGSGTQFDSRAIWYFDQTVEGWTGNGTPTLVDGWLRPANAAATPWVQSPAALAVDGSAYRFVKLRVKRVGSPTWAGFLQWITPTDQNWNTQKRVAIAEPAWDANGVATVDVQDIAWWPGTVDRIRLQLGAAQAVANYYLIDYVAVGRPTPGASVALVQAETLARTNAIAAEASQRNTLAVQMRGNYTGTDPLQLTSGLAYEELKARVAADSAQVQRINAMEVRMPAGTGGLATSASVTEEALARVSGDAALAQSITAVNATLPALIAQGSNLVVNGGWQFGRDVGWFYDSPSIVVASNEGRSGGACLRADGVNGVRRAVANGIVASGRDMTVSPGKKYRYGCWYKTSADFNGTADNSKLRLATQADALIGGATPFLPGKTEWTYVGLVYSVADSTSITALRLMIAMNHTAGTLLVDDVVLEEVTDVVANAEGLQALATTVQNQGGQITAQGNLISALRTDVDGKASNSALQSLQSQVTLQGNDITSLGTSINSVRASLNAVGGDNLLPNGSFEDSASTTAEPTSWVTETTMSAAVFSYVDSPLSGGGRAFRISATATAVGQYIGLASPNTFADKFKIQPNTDYVLSANVRGTAGGGLRMYIQWVDASNAVVGTSTMDSLTTTGVWQRPVFTTRTMNVNAVAARVFVGRLHSTVTGAHALELDNVMLQQGTVATAYMPSTREALARISANAAATSTLQGQVTSLQGTVTAQGSAITAVSAAAAAADSKAESAASGVSALTATVTQQGQQITAQASRIDGVQASVAGKADASVVQEMRVQVNNQGGGGNLIANSTFPFWQRNSWGWGDNPGGGWAELGNPTAGDPTQWNPTGVYGLGSRWSGALGQSGLGWFGPENGIAVEGGKSYCASTYLNTHRCDATIEVTFYNADSQAVGSFSSPWTGNTNTQAKPTLERLARPFVMGKAPAGASYARFRVYVRGLNPAQSDPYIWIFLPMLSVVSDGATQPPPWEAGNDASAQWSLAVQANGIAAGLQLGVTGQTSTFNILANAMNILSPGGADGIEMTNGYIRTWAGNSQRIIGNNFGADGLVDYFGPNVGAVNANKANATMWMDRNGNAYWGGAIAAGILRNAAQSTSIATLGDSVLVGPFDTNGRNKQVVVGFNRRHNRTKTAQGSQGFVAGAGTNGGVINLYRQLDGQVETLWQQIQITGSVSINNESDGPDTAFSSWSASLTLNDNANGTIRRSYRAEIVSFTEQTITHQSGSFDGEIITQSLSVVSIEQ